MNSTQIVKASINIFIVVAVAISLVQQMGNLNSTKSQQPIVTNSTTAEAIPTEMTGPKLQGVVIKTTDKFHNQVKQLLIKNNINAEISSYEFTGNEYYVNLVMNWGHIVLIYVLMNKYKSQPNADIKKKIMIGGGLAVIIWFFATNMLKPQRICIQAEGVIVYDRDYVSENQLMDHMSTYEFELDDLRESQDQINTQFKKEDAWIAEEQRKAQAAEPTVQPVKDEIYNEEEIF